MNDSKHIIAEELMEDEEEPNFVDIYHHGKLIYSGQKKYVRFEPQKKVDRRDGDDVG